MSLTPGVRLGAYEVVSLIGAGGMGEVYRARDARLGRDVAIKVLPAGVSSDSKRLQRFEQEARAAAALNHPNILAVHDIGQHDDAPYIVSELLEGETLRERLNGGALPVRKATEYGIQIAHGLAVAHEKGVVHRDLKPENIFVTTDGRVKILDFGLAKLTQAEPALSGMSALPTTPPDTLPGVVLGTIGYMAPEQVRGVAADYHSDIFAFGAILYEMLSGQRAFRGATTMDTMMAILREDPPAFPTTERHIPPALARIVDRCLEKNPAARFQSTRDLAFALEGLTSHSDSAGAVTSLPVRQAREQLAWMIAAGSTIALVAALAVGSVFYFRRAPADTRVYRSSILLPAGINVPAVLTPLARFTISPDGRRLAFVGAETGGVTRLWVQSLDGLAAQPLAGTEGASVPFWSPDSRFIGFRAGNKLKRIDAAGGPPLTLADAPGQAGTTWNRDGFILFGTFPGGPILRVPASGGAPSPATTLNAESGEAYHAYPSFLPDGRHFLYLAVGSKTAGPTVPNGIYLAGLDSNERKLLVPGGSNATYAQGYLLFLRGQTLMAQPFDVERLELTGEAVAIAEHVTTGGAAGVAGGFSVSETGVLAYQTGSVEVGGVRGGALTQLAWFDRSGKQIDVLGDQAASADLELAPDGKRAAVSVFDPPRRSRDIWLLDVARGLRTRFTFDTGDELTSIWSPDANRIVFNARRKGHLDLYQKRSSGEGAEEELLADDLDKYPWDWSPDGRFILFSVTAAKTGFDLWVLPLVGDRKPFPFIRTEFFEALGQFSPDGRWIAYTSTEAGREEVYVAPFPGAGGKWLVSAAGGGWPRWRGDGKEIFYLAPDNRLMAAAVNGQGSAFEVGGVRPLFDTRAIINDASSRSSIRSMYDVLPDGQRFLVNTLAQQAASAPITLVVNWPALLKK